MEFGEDPLLQQYLQQIHGVHCQVLDDCSCNNPKKNKTNRTFPEIFCFPPLFLKKKKKKTTYEMYIFLTITKAKLFDSFVVRA